MWNFDKTPSWPSHIAPLHVGHFGYTVVANISARDKKSPGNTEKALDVNEKGNPR